jgi:enoyl-CoA hydratase/carnithine racemase
MDPAPLIVERQTGVVRLILDRSSKANALSDDLVEALLDAVGAASGDGSRLLVLQGSGRNLSAGFDFSGLEHQSEADLLRRFVRIEQLLQTLYHAPIATLALAHGKNFGAGADLFVAAAIRICAPGTTFRMPGLSFGIQLGTRRLSHRIGRSAAFRLLSESGTLDASAALSLGLVDRIAEMESWPAVVQAELARATRLSESAHRRLASATTTDSRDADLADLVRSAMGPGLKTRISAYLDNR